MATRNKPDKNLTLRIRRTLGGSARRMGTRARVLAAILLCPLSRRDPALLWRYLESVQSLN